MSYYGPRMVSDGLLQHLDFQNPQTYPGSGTTGTDLMGNHNATLVTPLWNSSGFLVFDGSGSNDGVTTGDYLSGYGGNGGWNDTNQFSDGCTYTWWSRITDSQPNGQCFLRGNSTLSFLSFISEGTATPKFRSEAVTNGYSWTNGDLVIPGGSLVGRWVNFAIVFDFTVSPRIVRFYQNGEWFFTNDNFDDGGAGAAEHFYMSTVGQSTGTVSFVYQQSFKGELATFSFYGKPLSGKEVNQNYNSIRGRFGL